MLHASACYLSITQINNFQQSIHLPNAHKIYIRISLNACDWIPTQASIRKGNLKEVGIEGEKMNIHVSRNDRIPGVGCVSDIAGSS